MTYGFTFDGELIILQYEWSIFKIAGSELIMVLVPFSCGAFHNQLIKALFENPEMEKFLIAEIINVMKKSNFKGICLDFDYISPVYAIQYAEFVNRLRNELHMINKKAYVALPSKQSDNDKGLHLEGIDYEMLGNKADAVYLKTYEWAHIYGPPGACAPLHEVEKTVQYAVSHIKSEKVLLGVSLFGYDWPLPYEKGITRASKVSNLQAQKTAEEKGAVIEYGEISKSPWFKYKDNGTEHVVWYEDEFSIKIKQDLVKKYKLKGVFYNDFIIN